MKKFFEEFKAFISRGNVIDMAVGVVIGSAFSKIITALVENIITPLISIITGKIDITSLRWIITPAGDGVEELSLKYGMFIQSLIDFLIIAFSIFCAIKVVSAVANKFAHKKEVVEEVKEVKEPDETVLLLREIRDSLKENK